jgi:hypothetical protein
MLWAGTYGNGMYVFAGDVGTVLYARNLGDWWEPRNPLCNYYCYLDIASDGLRCVAVGARDAAGGPVIVGSSDFINWNEVPPSKLPAVMDSPIRVLFAYATWPDWAIPHGRFAVFYEGGSILFSGDGQSWESIGSDLTKFVGHGTGGVVGVAYGGDVFVAAGRSGWISCSVGVFDWIDVSMAGGYNTWRDIAYGDGLFVIVGDEGAIGTSNDGGVTWSSVVSGTKYDLRSVAYGNGTFVTISYSGGVVLTSPDGQDWVVSPNPTSALDCLRVIFMPTEPGSLGVFMMLGDDGTIFASQSGMAWMRQDCPTRNELRAGCYFNGSFFAVGRNGTILQCQFREPIFPQGC